MAEKPKIVMELQLETGAAERIFQEVANQLQQKAASNPIVMHMSMADPTGSANAANTGSSGVHTAAAAGRKGTPVTPTQSRSALDDITNENFQYFMGPPALMQYQGADPNVRVADPPRERRGRGMRLSGAAAASHQRAYEARQAADVSLMDMVDFAASAVGQGFSNMRNMDSVAYDSNRLTERIARSDMRGDFSAFETQSRMGASASRLIGKDSISGSLASLGRATNDYEKALRSVVRGASPSDLLQATGIAAPDDPALTGLKHREAFERFRQSTLGKYAISAFQNVGSVVAMQGAAMFQAQTQEVLTGRPDHMAQSGARWGMGVGVAGAAAGSIFGPMGGFIGGFGGQQLGTMMGEFFAANKVADIRRSSALMPIGNTLANWAGDFSTHPWQSTQVYSAGMSGSMPVTSGGIVMPGLAGARRLSQRAQDMANPIGERYFADPTTGQYKDFYATPEQIAGAYGAVGTAMILGGEDPEAMIEGVEEEYQHKIGTRRVADIDPATGKQRTARRRRRVQQPPRPFGSTDPQNYGRIAENFVRASGIFEDYDEPLFKEEDVFETRTRKSRATAMQFQTENLARRYGTSIEQMQQVYASIKAVKPETGDNAADIIMRFGPIAASQYSEMQTPIGGTPTLGSRQSVEVFNQLRGLNRQASFAATNVAPAAALEGIAGDKMNTLATLPGGANSLAYAEANQERRGYKLQRLADEQIDRFGIPSMQHQGRMMRARMMPFGTGNNLSLEVENVRMNQRELGFLGNEMSELQRSGDLSPQMRMQYLTQMEGLKNSIFQSGAMFSEGMEAMLPAMTSGRTPWQGRHTSAGLVALRLGAAGSPMGAYGAANGGQMAWQNSFISAFNETGPTLSGGSGGSKSGSLREVADLLRMIIRNQERAGSGNSMRPSEARGSLGSAMNRSGLDTNNLYKGSN